MFIPREPRVLTGDEPVGDSGARVVDFWRWVTSDLRTNNMRGLLAEFLVARAVGDQATGRIEWAKP